jgi:hypothetical protein
MQQMDYTDGLMRRLTAQNKHVLQSAQCRGVEIYLAGRMRPLILCKQFYISSASMFL